MPLSPPTSCSERTIPHDLFTPLLIGSISVAGVLCLVLILLFYKYMQVRQSCLCVGCYGGARVVTP